MYDVTRRHSFDLQYVSLPFSEPNWPFFIATLLVALYWLWRVAQAARQKRVLRMAWWGLPGLLCLFMAPVLEIEYLLGIGAVFLLVAEFFPNGFVPSRKHPDASWPIVGALLGLVLLLSMSISSSVGNVWVYGLSWLCLLWGTASTVSAAFFKGNAVDDLQDKNILMRLKKAKEPEQPDLSVTLTPDGAELHNVSKQTLTLAGWSPATSNGWLVFRDEQGRPLNNLKAGQMAFIPLEEYEAGIRVWYVSGSLSEPLLFKADWTPQTQMTQRILN